MRKKNIWIINQTAGKRDSGWGERHFFLSQYWVKKGYDVKIISGSYNHLFTHQPIIKKRWFTSEKVEEGIEFFWVKTPKYVGGGFKKFWSNLIYTCKLFFLSSKKIGKPDIILVSSMPIFPIIAGSFLKKKYKADKLIIEIRDLWPLTPIHLKGYSKNHPLIIILFWFEKFAYKNADTIVSLLPNAGSYINEISKDEKKLYYIPNGINEAHIDREEISTEIANLIPKDKFIIGYTGTIGMANAMEYFIDASLLINNKNIHFLLVGNGYLKEEYQRKVKNSINITFIDKIKKNQIQSILTHFDVCYVGRYKSPLYKYGVSYNKYFDYMLARKPILESSELIKDQVELSNCGIIVSPENPLFIIDGIEKFYLMNEVERSIIGNKGYEYVCKYHTYSYLSDLYIKIF